MKEILCSGLSDDDTVEELYEKEAEAIKLVEEGIYAAEDLEKI